ncbi:pilus assembly protein PilM [Romboutsia weinsteinii]|uniref:Pilus assembly protein PilM n=1 Tax=Romboutsia weinsteinii TaxID=2020949 RepID=A0A371J1R5_9FIRM|nr:pilus assembly protein PilM [Romboutsia weinsteinii]RDY26606.1 pilus assembly protein PilM [Romboutsia weinsteinii]
MGGYFIKNIITLDLNDDYVKLNFIRKYNRSIHIDKSVYRLFEEGSISYNNKSYLEKINNILKDELQNTNKSYKDIYFNLQNENVIVRNIKIPNIKKRKDIFGMIENEITQYIPIDIKNYVVKYNVLNSNDEDLDLQVILFPKIIIDTCMLVCKQLKLRAKALNINLNILQKIINLDIIKEFGQEAIFIEEKRNDFILNIAKNRTIQESYILQKNFQSYEFAKGLLNQNKDIFYYGERLELFNEILSDKYETKILSLKENIKVQSHIDEVYEENINYINSIGMII